MFDYPINQVHAILPKSYSLDNSLILHIYIIIRKNYNTYFELIHAFYSWFWNNVE